MPHSGSFARIADVLLMLMEQIAMVNSVPWCCCCNTAEYGDRKSPSARDGSVPDNVPDIKHQQSHGPLKQTGKVRSLQPTKHAATYHTVYYWAHSLPWVMWWVYCNVLHACTDKYLWTWVLVTDTLLVHSLCIANCSSRAAPASQITKSSHIRPLLPFLGSVREEILASWFYASRSYPTNFPQRFPKVRPFFSMVTMILARDGRLLCRKREPSHA